MKRQDKGLRQAVQHQQEARATRRRDRRRQARAAARQKTKRGGPQRLGAAPVKGLGVLGRVVGYGEKMYGLWDLLWNLRDGRLNPDIPAGRVAISYAVLMLVRLKSLNAFEQGQSPTAWARWLGGPRPSADVMGDCAATMDLDPLRKTLRVQHGVRKRGKGFGPGPSGMRYLVLDGHEGVSSYRRSWEGALQREVQFAKETRTQYYFRYVGAYLTNGTQRILLDAESVIPGEDEIACALRLLTRLFAQYPRAFDVVCGDALYADPRLWKLVRPHNKHIIAVLKNENRDLLQDARALFKTQTPINFDDQKTRRQCWDLEGFTSWPQCGENVRVARSCEQTTVLPQKGNPVPPGQKPPRKKQREPEVRESEWFWVTSLPQFLASTKTVVCAGHRRWHIENYGFNELSNQWHGDHAYRYHGHALIACTLLLFIAYNLFHAFVECNLKPQARAGRTRDYWSRCINAAFVTAFYPEARAT